MKNQGAGSNVIFQDKSTQVDKSEVIVGTSEMATWVQQSPGAVGRHTQTDKVKMVQKKTNTELKLSKSRGTQMDHDQQTWGDLMELQYEDRDSTSHTSVHSGGFRCVKGAQVVSSPQKGEAPQHPSVLPSKWVGLEGLQTLLDTLEVSGSTMDQFATNIRLQNRNKHSKAIVEIASSEPAEYWVIFDDISMKVKNVGQTLITGQYVKMYGQCETLFQDKYDNATTYCLHDPQSKLFQRCERLASMELEKVLPQIKSRHVESYQWGAYGHPDSYKGGYDYSRSPHGGYGGYRRYSANGDEY
jgi:hypothetical protein